jgi:PAB-dependent poly(A)-specific ribonuclease subunit 3
MISSEIDSYKNNSSFNIYAPKWSPTRLNQEKESSPSFTSQQTQSSSQSMSSSQPTWQQHPSTLLVEGDLSQEQYPMTTQTTQAVETTAESNPATLPRGNLPNPPWGTVRSNNAFTQPHYKNIHSYGLPNHTLWSLYRSIAMDCTREMDPHDARYKAIPPNFTNAMPLEQVDRISNNGKGAATTHTVANVMNHNMSSTRSSFGYHSSIFRVTNQEDGKLYCLRRFDHVRGVNQKIASTVTSAWTRAVMHRSSSRSSSSTASVASQGRIMMTMTGRGGGGVGGGGGRGDPQKRRLLEHPGLVRFYKCFYVVSNRAVFFLHEYHPMSLTLRECVYGMERGGMMGGWTEEHALAPGAFRPLEEEVIWSYITQLVSAVRAVHRANMACRTLQLHHILVCPDAGSGMDETAAQMMMMSTSMGSEVFALRTNRVRLRINCLGVVDALEFEARKTVQELQMEDMKCLGRIILSLASGTEVRGNASDELYNQCQEFMQQNYSSELCKLTAALLARPRPGRMGMMIVDPPTIDDVCRVIAEHALDEMDSAHVIIDGMDQALAAEYESGRVLRLMMKLAFINERPEFGVDPRWSESGDCYVLKLFRDYGEFQFLIHCMAFQIHS